MGGYFSTAGYAPQKSSLDFTEGLSSVGDALTDVLNRRQKAQQASAELDFQKQDAQRKFAQNQANDAYQNRIVDQRAKQQALEFNQRQEEMKRRASIDASKALGDNNPELAKTILHGTVTYDPTTGSENGRGELAPGPMKDIGPEPQQPVAPVAPAGIPPEIAARRRGLTNTSEQPPEAAVPQRPANFIPSGVVATSDDKPADPRILSSRTFDPETQAARFQDTKDMAAEEQARLDQQQFGQQKTAFDAASAAYPGARAAYDATRTQAERERPYTIKFGANDAGVQVTPEAQRYGHRQAAADDFVESLHGVSLDARGQQAAQAAHAAIMAGEDPQKVYKAFEAARTMGQTQDWKHGENQFHEQEADKRAAMAAASPKDAFYRERAQEGYAAGNRQDRGELRQELGDWEKNTADIRKDAGVWKRLRMSQSNIKADNPVAQQDALLGLASVFRGGNAATKDVTTAVRSHLGGAEANAEGWLEQAATGKLGPEQQRTALGAVQNAVREHDEQIREHYRSFVKRFGPGNGLEPQAQPINGFMDSILEEHGLSAPPVYDSADPQSGAMGSTQRPYKQKPAPRRGPPEIEARRRGKAAGTLDDAMQ